MLLAHGLLHLLGWDHDTVAKDRAMRRETDLLCAMAEKKRRTVRAYSTPRREAAPNALRATFRMWQNNPEGRRF